jgi:hypothetical protein
MDKEDKRVTLATFNEDEVDKEFLPYLERFNRGSSWSRVGNFHSFGSVQVRIFRRRYASSR